MSEERVVRHPEPVQQLTWLSSRAQTATLPMRAEALEASFAAIEAADEADTDSDIRTWIASETGDHSWLLAVLAQRRVASGPGPRDGGEHARRAHDTARTWHSPTRHGRLTG
jgi:predicted transcriptional regulator